MTFAEKVLVSGDAAFRARTTPQEWKLQRLNLEVSGHSFMEAAASQDSVSLMRLYEAGCGTGGKKLETRMKCNQQKNKEMNLVPSMFWPSSISQGLLISSTSQESC